MNDIIWNERENLYTDSIYRNVNEREKTLEIQSVTHKNSFMNKMQILQSYLPPLRKQFTFGLQVHVDGIQIYKILNSSKQTKVAWPDFTPAPSFIIYSAHRNNTRTRPWRLRPDRNAFIFYSARTGLATQPRPNS